MDVDELAQGVATGDRRSLARAITLVESTLPEHRERAEALLERLLDRTGGAVRVGLTGPPGAGKSTLIDALGRHLVTERGRRLAVLAVDPTSVRSGGSILGDKARMGELAREPAAFIRPSPAGTTLGGVARRTRESMLLCEAAGFDTVIVETVGTGQSETAVADMVDTFCVLVSPAGGDELQGIKRGVLELADIVAVTKADGDLAAAARIAAAEHRRALHLLAPRHPGWRPRVLTVSALTGAGVDELWDAVLAHRETLGPDGLAALRADQLRAWLRTELDQTLMEVLRSDPRVAGELEEATRDVVAGRRLPPRVARRIISTLIGRTGDRGGTGNGA